MNLSVCTDVGCVRETNEDSYCAVELGEGQLLGAVADGMGGNEAGEIASSLAIAVLEERLRQTPDAGDDAGGVLAQAITQANTVIFTTAGERPECWGMGTTLTAVLITPAGGYLAHVGDSRAYRLRDGVLSQLTEDHSLVGEMVKNGKLTELGAMAHPQKHILTRALGTDPRVRYDLAQVELAAGDILILCTDGLTNLVTSEEVREETLRPEPFATLAKRLVNLANQRGGYDNTTVVALHLD